MKAKKVLNRIRRSLLFFISPSRTFYVPIDKCITETGHSYGKNGNHFFIKALQRGESQEEIRHYLRDFYSKNIIKSFNDFVGERIDSKEGDDYFLPWEKDRIRPISKFLGSHKIGPTPSGSLDLIVKRLHDILVSIKKHGFKQKRHDNSIIRVQILKNEKGEIKYLVRDGQHRLAIASYLGVKNILVTLESVYFFRESEESIIDANQVLSWEKVKSGLITKDQALFYFNQIFNCNVNYEDN